MIRHIVLFKFKKTEDPKNFERTRNEMKSKLDDLPDTSTPVSISIPSRGHGTWFLFLNLKVWKTLKYTGYTPRTRRL